ncbi:ROK family protein [Bacillus sp. FSL H8-0547]
MPSHDSAHLIKRANEQLILKELVRQETFIKKNLAAQLGLSFPTVSKMLDDLEEKNVIMHTGMASSSNGRRASIYGINPAYGSILVLYIQYSRFWILVANAKKDVLLKEERTLGQDYLSTIKAIIKEMKARFTDLNVISIGVPAGVMDGEIKYMNYYDDLQGLHLKKILEEKFRVQVTVERDVNAMLQGWVLGADGEKTKNVSLLIFTDDGPGAASLINGRILRGFSAFAGEVGFLPIGEGNTLQDKMTQPQTQEESVYHAAHLISVISIMLNPETLILSGDDSVRKLIPDIVDACKQRVPEVAVPKIQFSADYHQLYSEGLLEAGRNALLGIETDL